MKQILCVYLFWNDVIPTFCYGPFLIEFSKLNKTHCFNTYILKDNVIADVAYMKHAGWCHIVKSPLSSESDI